MQPHSHGLPIKSLGTPTEWLGSADDNELGS